MKNPLKPCSRKEKDCHSITRSGKCCLLQDTKFKRPCPFYKPEDAIEKKDLKYFPNIMRRWNPQK